MFVFVYVIGLLYDNVILCGEYQTINFISKMFNFFSLFVAHLCHHFCCGFRCRCFVFFPSMFFSFFFLIASLFIYSTRIFSLVICNHLNMVFFFRKNCYITLYIFVWISYSYFGCRVEEIWKYLQSKICLAYHLLRYFWQQKYLA